MESKIVDAIGPALLDAAAAAGIGIAIAAIGEDGPRLIYVNEVTCGLLGEEKASILTRTSFFDLVAPADRERVREIHTARSRGEDPDARLEFRVLQPSGEEVPVAAGVCMTQVGAIRAAVVLFTDMRARTTAVAQLQASEKRFQDLVEAAPDGIVISRRADIVYANRAAGELLGLPREALVGRSLGEFLPPDGIARMRERMAVIGHGAALAPSTYRATRPDGTTVVAEIASIVTEYEGVPSVLAFARDVTERAQLSAALERTARLAAVGRLAAGMAHEINNPLAFISLSREALERKLAGVLPPGADREEVMSLLQDVARGSVRVTGIVRDLKAFSRDGEREAEPGPVDLDPVIASAMRIVEHLIAARGRAVRVRVASGALPRVLGDPRRLEQVFVNLLVNAAHALPEGGNGTIEVRETLAPGSVVIEVRDDGKGIAAEHVGRVFDPFFTTKPVGGGTGLGLSVCHGIVTSFGGSITIESELSHGTTVRVTLLRVPDDRPSSAADSAALATLAAPPKERPRLLIVEDQDALALTLARLLSEQYEVEIASRVLDALARLAKDQRPFDVVLCDMVMPDGTGIEVFEGAIRERPEIGRRFIFMTGGAFTTDVARFLETTPNPQLEKPFPISELEELIVRTIG